MSDKVLSCEVQVQMRFSEVDSLGMVWHGNYLHYLEDGREAFGRQFGLEYMYIYSLGFVAPIVDVQIRYLQPAGIDDKLIVETTYVPGRAAKMVYRYTIRRAGDHTVILQAQTTQLFKTVDGEFVVSKPDFMRSWEQRWGLGG